MNRRSFLSALGLAPLAAWLTSRVSAEAVPVADVPVAEPPPRDAPLINDWLERHHAPQTVAAYIADGDPNAVAHADPPSHAEWDCPRCRYGVVTAASGREDCGECDGESFDGEGGIRVYSEPLDIDGPGAPTLFAESHPPGPRYVGVEGGRHPRHASHR